MPARQEQRSQMSASVAELVLDSARVGLLVILTVTPLPALAGNRYYCPWADTVLRLTFDDNSNRMALLSERGVPLQGSYVAKKKRVRIGAADVDQISFEIPDQEYQYTFNLRRWIKAGTVELDSLRVSRETGRQSNERKWCFIERQP